MVLGVLNDTTYVTGTRVMEENLGINVGQKWTIGQKFDNDDYFNITNPASGKVLTAKSTDELTIEGMFLRYSADF